MITDQNSLSAMETDNDTHVVAGDALFKESVSPKVIKLTKCSTKNYMK